MKQTPLLLALTLSLFGQFSMEQIRSNPFPNELTAASSGSRIAWAFNQAGQRNIWVAEGPEFRARKLTAYNNDDGQELTSVTLSSDGRYVVYVRGGDHGSNWDRSVPVNADSGPVLRRVQVWTIPFDGGEPKALGEGDLPTISSRSDRVAYESQGGIWSAPVDGSAAGKRLFTARGICQSPIWSPDGSRLAFVSNRGTHALIGIYIDDSTPIQWLTPSTSRDTSPRWSPDSKKIGFVRLPGTGGAPRPLLERIVIQWSIWSANTSTGEGRQLWQSPSTLRGNPPTTNGGTNLHWSAAKRIVFMSYEDGWPHLYSLPEDGGAALRLTTDKYMVEYITMSPDGRYLVGAANTGPRADDIDRRHIVKIPVDRAGVEVLTPGMGLEWTPVVTGDGATIAFLRATAQMPPLPAVMTASGGEARTIFDIPASFPTNQLVTPKQVIFKAPDGLSLHGQLFETPGGTVRKPAIVYVHGGPQRQMLLGWHYSDYYANAYALNQYLASRGYIVLAVNYRLGIGYGYDFHRPRNSGAEGATESLDVRAAGEYLRALPNVDPKRIGIYGGSYGGFLTAMALGRDSSLFAAGVDIHGVHDLTLPEGLVRYEKSPDLARARDIAWKSSPISYISTWRSPVLLIHGDDDRNVQFGQTVDLVRRLSQAGRKFEEIVIPDDTHHFLRNANQLRVDQATADFFDRMLR